MRLLLVLIVAALLIWFGFGLAGGDPADEVGGARVDDVEAGSAGDGDASGADGTGGEDSAAGDGLRPYEPPTTDDPDEAAAPSEVVATPTGRLVGRVLLGRENMPPEPIDRSADPALADADPIWDESMIIGPDTGVQDVLVWAVRSSPLDDGDREPVELTIRHGRFEPRLVVVAPGQTVRLVNADPTTYDLAAMPQVELSLSGKPNNDAEWVLGPDESVEHTFKQPEVAIPIVGRYPHDWLVGWVAVLDRPHGRTDAFGRYELELPVGDQALELWHETLDTREGFVTIREDDEVDWSVTFTAGRRGRGQR